MSRTLQHIGLVGLLLTPVVATAGQREAKAARQAAILEGEVRRLENKMELHAPEQRWDPVESAYKEILELGGEPSRKAHLQAAQAARFRGDMLQFSLRLRRAADIENDPELTEEIRRLDQEYGRVVVRIVGEAVLPPLSTEVSTFNPDPRRAIEYAREQLIAERAFRGLLPIGEYTLGPQTFTVVPGSAWATIDVQAPSEG